ncbi:TPA: hypothetical protein ACH3X1_009965 [Trebouxia sp. C0004]
MPFQSTRGAKRSAVSENLIPATAPATKLHKDTSGDVRTAATVTAAVRTSPLVSLWSFVAGAVAGIRFSDTADRLAPRVVTAAVPTDATGGATPAAQSLVQLTQVEWQAALARLSVVEQLQSQLTEAQSQLKAAEATFGRKFEEQTQSGIARENAVKDSCQQEINALDSIVEALSQRIKARNMVVHRLSDTAAVSNPAALERLVKARVDSVGPNRESSPVSQSITAITRIGRPGAGNRAVLVEYSSSQAKHRTYALSRQLRQQGISMTDELTPKQQQAQKALDPDRIALRSKGFRTWFRHGTLWYLDQGVPRECKQGEAVKLPQPQGSPPRPNMPAAKAPPRGPSSHLKQAPGRSRGSIPTCAPRANRVVAPIVTRRAALLHLFLQAASRLVAPQALSAPRMPLWLGVTQSLLWTWVLLLLLVQLQVLLVWLHLILLAPLQLPLQSAQSLHQLGPLLPQTPNRRLPASSNSNCPSPY